MRGIFSMFCSTRILLILEDETLGWRVRIVPEEETVMRASGMTWS